MNFVIFLNATTLVFLGLLMGIDAAVFPDVRSVFAFSSAQCIAFGALLMLPTATRTTDVTRKQAFILTSSVWMTAALAGAVPLWHFGLSTVDAFFESMSAITTTGSTVMSGLDTTPHGILFWRATLQFVGGVGFVVTGIALLPLMRVGGMQLFRTESSDKGEKEFSTAADFAIHTLGVYFALNFICALGYLIGGMTPFDAVTHAMTTLSTGGFSNYDASFGHFEQPYLHWQATAFMLLGGLPFAWYIRLFRKGHARSEQVRMMLLALTATISILTLLDIIKTGQNPVDALRLVSFNVISVVTTTGYATDDYTTWGAFAVIAFFILTASGGCTGSTSGGLKAMRLIIAGRALLARLRNVIHPNRITSVRYEGRPVEEDVLSSVIGFVFFYFASFGVLSVMLNFAGLDFVTSITGALTALANVGPGLGDIIGPAGNFASLNGISKTILSFGMYAGRLEMLTLYVLFVPMFWRST